MSSMTAHNEKNPGQDPRLFDGREASGVSLVLVLLLFSFCFLLHFQPGCSIEDGVSHHATLITFIMSIRYLSSESVT